MKSESLNLLINYQEILDYESLYQMFGDEDYRIKSEKLQGEILICLYRIINVTGKYLMLSNQNEQNKQTYFNTVIIVENDARNTLVKLNVLLESLGTIEHIKCYQDRMDIKIKGEYELTLYNFSHGVI